MPDPTKPTYEELQEGFKAALDAGDRLTKELTEARVQHDACHQTTDDLLGERDRTITALRETLESIRDHDGQRWTWNDGIAEPQTGMQEIAKAALAATGETGSIVHPLPTKGETRHPFQERIVCSVCGHAHSANCHTDWDEPSTDPASTVECPTCNGDGHALLGGCFCTDCEGSGRIPKPVGGETDD